LIVGVVEKPLGAVVPQAFLFRATADLDAKCDVVDATFIASVEGVFQIIKRAIAMAVTAAEVHGRRDEFQRRVPKVGKRLLQLTPNVDGRLSGEVSLRADARLVEPEDGFRIARNAVSDSCHGVIVSPTHGNEFDGEVVVESVTPQGTIS
jgi:hypothetical protein